MDCARRPGVGRAQVLWWWLWWWWTGYPVPWGPATRYLTVGARSLCEHRCAAGPAVVATTSGVHSPVAMGPRNQLVVTNVCAQPRGGLAPGADGRHRAIEQTGPSTV